MYSEIISWTCCVVSDLEIMKEYLTILVHIELKFSCSKMCCNCTTCSIIMRTHTYMYQYMYSN